MSRSIMMWVGGKHPFPVMLYDSDRTGNFEVYRRMGAGGSVQLTNNNVFDSWWPKVSPNGQSVLFYRTPAGVHDSSATQASLWKMDRNGGNQTEIIADNANGWDVQGHAEWSPDGSRIGMFAGTGGTLLLHTDATGGDVQAVLPPFNAGHTDAVDPSWSPDGTQVAYAYQGNIWTSPLVTGTPLQLTSDGFTDFDPYYSPDGQYIAFLTQVSVTPSEWAIRKMKTDGTELGFVINDGKVNSKPEWSADSNYIFFHRSPAGGGDAGFFGLWYIKLDGSKLTAIPTGTGSNEYPDRDP